MIPDLVLRDNWRGECSEELIRAVAQIERGLHERELHETGETLPSGAYAGCLCRGCSIKLDPPEDAE